MNKEQFIKQRARKYFWEQKKEEVIDFSKALAITLFAFLIFILISMIIGAIAYSIFGKVNYCTLELQDNYYGCIISSGMIETIMFGVFIVLPLTLWILKNKEIAKERAEEDWERR